MTDPRQRFDLSGRAALVTGGTRGLGRAIAQGLAEAGARVAITGRKSDACEAAAKELREQTGGEILPVACHMGDWDALPRLVEKVTDTFSSLEEAEVAHSKKASRKHRKVAAQLRDDEGAEAAASYLLDHGLKDEAVETYLEAELFDRAATVGRPMGLDLRWVRWRGSSDGNIAASFGVPVLDGLGPAGDGAHQPAEHIVTGDLPLRLALLSDLMVSLAPPPSSWLSEEALASMRGTRDA